MGEALEDCPGKSLAPQDFGPVRERQIGGDDETAAFVGRADEVEQQLRALCMGEIRRYRTLADVLRTNTGASLDPSAAARESRRRSAAAKGLIVAPTNSGRVVQSLQERCLSVVLCRSSKHTFSISVASPNLQGLSNSVSLGNFDGIR